MLTTTFVARAAVWPIESDGSDRVALKALLGLPAQPWRRRLPVLPHRCSFWCMCSISWRVQLNHDLPRHPQMEIIRHFKELPKSRHKPSMTSSGLTLANDPRDSG